MRSDLYIIMLLCLFSACSINNEQKENKGNNQKGTQMYPSANNKSFAHKGEAAAYTKAVAVVEDYVKKTVTEADKERIKAELNEQIAEWANTKVNNYFYTKMDYVMSDNLIFNAEKDKVIILLEGIKKEKKHGTVKTITGHKVVGQEKWQYNESGRLPVFSYEYDDELREGVEFTIRELDFRTIDNFCEDGLVRQGKINQKYFEKWF